ncbi:MAG TPA: phage holin family protein [Mycobacteriales bacterium]|nr:phage holin family protein [Mycobacteriales bacterium]
MSERSIGELIGEVTQDLTKLVSQELALAKTELTVEAKKAGKTAGEFGAAGLAGYFAVLFASLTLMFALASWWDSYVWAALAVTVLWAIAGAVLFSRARKQVKDINPKPEMAIQEMKEGVR